MIIVCSALALVAFLATGNILFHYGVDGHVHKGLIAGVVAGLAAYLLLTKELDTPFVILASAIGLELLFSVILRNRK